MSFNAALLMLEEYQDQITKIPVEEWTLEEKIALFCFEGLVHNNLTSDQSTNPRHHRATTTIFEPRTPLKSSQIHLSEEVKLKPSKSIIQEQDAINDADNDDHVQMPYSHRRVPVVSLNSPN